MLFAKLIFGEFNGFATLAEHKSRLYLALPIANKSAQAANDAITTLLAPIKHWVKTLTFDNGREFSWHNKLAKTLSCCTYRLNSPHVILSKIMSMKFIDLFAGIGGIKIAFENAGFDCVFSNDFDKNSKITFDLNVRKISNKMILGDIQDIKTYSIPDFDILCGGFPCQPFSVAGYRQGFEDERGRGNLFFDIIRILKDKKPRAFLLENVKNLKTHDKGNTIKVIYQELEKLGYKVKDQVLNSMEYGNLPQNRERIYIVGFLEKKSFDDFKFPEKIPLTKTIHNCLENKEVDDKYYYNDKPLYEKIKNDIVKKNTVYQWRRKYVRENKNNVCPTLTANMGMGGHNVPLILNGKGIRKITPRECIERFFF
jgi:DNA (cytosine-5)-methyltransferase 1